MPTQNVVQAIELSEFNSATLTGLYQRISAATGLPAACIILRIINNSTVDVTISFDGTTDHEYLRAGNQLTLNFQTNSQPSAMMSCMSAGTKVYIKGTAGTGDIYLGAYFNPQGI